LFDTNRGCCPDTTKRLLPLTFSPSFVLLSFGPTGCPGIEVWLVSGLSTCSHPRQKEDTVSFGRNSLIDHVTVPKESLHFSPMWDVLHDWGFNTDNHHWNANRWRKKICQVQMQSKKDTHGGVQGKPWLTGNFSSNRISIGICVSAPKDLKTSTSHTNTNELDLVVVPTVGATGKRE
jgi:hypothetical protein